MANENNETFGQTVLRGMAWGLGFAIVSVPVGMIIHSIFDDDDKQQLAMENALYAHEWKLRKGIYNRDFENEE